MVNRAALKPATVKRTSVNRLAKLAASKVGGMVGPPVVGALLTGSGSLFLPAVVIAVPIAVAAIVLVFIGEETRARGLEHISRR